MDLKRYKRQLLLEEDYNFDQQKLLKSTVFIAGAGGLGSPAAYYLAAAGVGRIIICDNDIIDITNLNRQILHSVSRLGMNKAESAAAQLSDLNPDITITAKKEMISSNVTELAEDADLIIDCLDNIETRYALNEYSIKTGTPIVHGGLNGYAGQISFLSPPQTPCIRCIFPVPAQPEGPIPVIGATAGIIGSMQALEAVKYLSGSGRLLKNILRFYDGFSNEIEDITISKDPHCPACR